MGDGPATAAARIMGLSLTEFEKLLPEYLKRHFPSPDEVSGLFDLDAILEWRRRRYPHLYGLTDPDDARDARGLVRKRIGEMSRGKARTG